MTIGIKVKGIPQTQHFLKSKNKDATNLINKAIIKSGFFVEAEVKESIAGRRAEPTSVDTGRFINSVKNVQNAILTATIASNLVYAKFLEYGTSRMKARHHFTNTAKRNEKKVRGFINDELIKL